MSAPIGRRGFTLMELLVVIAIMAVLMGLTIPAVQRVRDAAYRLKCANNLKQIGLALQEYHDSQGTLPPGVSVRNGKDSYPFLGWQARILPFVEQESLWERTRLAYQRDRWPFDNPPHVGLDTVLAIYTCPADGRTLSAQTIYGYHVAFTSYLGVEGTNQHTGDGVLYMDSQVRLTDVTDGTSNTLMVGERPPSADLYYGWWYAGTGQDYTGSCDMVLGLRELNTQREGFWGCAPGPYAYSQGRLFNQCDQFHFWSLHFGGAHFLFVDGSVHFLRYSAAPIMAALATRSGGEAVSQDY